MNQQQSSAVKAKAGRTGVSPAPEAIIWQQSSLESLLVTALSRSPDPYADLLGAEAIFRAKAVVSAADLSVAKKQV